MDQALDCGLVQVADVASRLPRFLTHHHAAWVDQPEGVDHDLSLDGLDRVDNYCHGTRVQLLEGLLCVNVDAGEPAAEPGLQGDSPACQQERDLEVSAVT